MLDLTFVHDLVRDGYVTGIGRPSVDPVVFFRLQLVMFFEGIRSERALLRLAADRLSVRWYLGYNLDEALPDHSSLTGALLVSLVVSLLGFDPVQLMFWANVLQGVLAPVLVVLLLLVGNNRRIMGSYRLGRLTNLGLILIALVMSGAALLLFYGLLFGRGG